MRSYEGAILRQKGERRSVIRVRYHERGECAEARAAGESSRGETVRRRAALAASCAFAGTYISSEMRVMI